MVIFLRCVKFAHSELRTCSFIGFYSNDDEWTRRRKRKWWYYKKNLGQLLCISIMAVADTPKGNVSLFLLYIIFPVTSISRESKIKYDNFIIIINFAGQTRCYASDWWLVARKLYRFKTIVMFIIQCVNCILEGHRPHCVIMTVLKLIYSNLTAAGGENAYVTFFSDHFFKYLFWKCLNKIKQYFKFFHSMTFSCPVRINRHRFFIVFCIYIGNY